MTPNILLLDSLLTGDFLDSLQRVIRSSCPAADIRRRPAGAGSVSETARRFEPNVVLITVGRESVGSAAALLSEVRAAAPHAAFLAVADGCEAGDFLTLLRSGFDDFITAPPRPIDIVARIHCLLKPRGADETLTLSLKEKLGLRQLVGESPAFAAEIKKIPLVAKCGANLLISGETGTGKELCARAVHYLGPRAEGPFIAVNCGAIPADLMENELFGHDRGAYTGAATTECGLVEEADGGTLFLDEIDCLPLLAQSKLLRFIQEKEYRPLGSSRTRKADVRVVAAANVELEEAVREGRLRRDLYYRLNIITLRLPPLRERREDIPALAQHFLSKYAEEFNKGTKELTPEANHALMLYDWPGNVRELEHTVERAVVLCEHARLGVEDLSLPRGSATATARESFRELKAGVVEQFEKSYLVSTLLACEGNITKAAQLARKNRRAFWQLLRKHRIDINSLKSSA